MCTADMGRSRENSVVQVAGKEQRELGTSGREGTGRTVYRWLGRNRENCVQVAGKEQRELCTGGWEGTEITVYRWLGRNRENCVQVAGK